MDKELINKRNHREKHFDMGGGVFKCRLGSSNLHYFDGKEYRDIDPIQFPEGKIINSEADLDMIDIPSWGVIEIVDNGDRAILKDQAGFEIQSFNQAFVCDKDAEPFSIIDNQLTETAFSSVDLDEKRKKLNPAKEEKIKVDNPCLL
jgi:hypothetical protein